ncbi:MAG: hypothetical protein ACR2H3_01015 [Acidimicrobiales bacterium]
MRRLLIILTACILVAGGCAQSEDLPLAGEAGGGVVLPGDSTPAPTGGEAAPSSPRGQAPTGSAPRSSSPGTASPNTTSNSSAAPPALDKVWLGGPGSYARRILQPTPATSVALDVMQQAGAEPRSGTLEHLRSRLALASNKTISVGAPTTVPGGAQSWTGEQLRKLADDLGTIAHTGDRAVVRVLLLRGDFPSGGEGRVLGVAVRGDVFALFTDQIANSASVLAPRSEVEKAVALHEMGHILGLVGNVVNQGRQDPDHPGHSSNRESVMYWAIDSSLFATVLNGPPPTEFDNQDRADLETIRRGG